MTVNPDSFRQALSRFASGVTVVTAVSHEGEPTGVTVSAFASVSLRPPMVLICLDMATRNLDAYTNGDGFAVNILAADQNAVSDAFAYPGPVSPFERVGHSITEAGLAVLDGTIASLICRRAAVHEGGDHKIVLGEVLDATWRPDKEPLMYAMGGYADLAARNTA